MSLLFVVWTAILTVMFIAAAHMQRVAHHELDEAQKCLDRAIAIHEEVRELRRVGDDMAGRIRERWCGPDGCDCVVCSAAAAWEEVRSA